MLTINGLLCKRTLQSYSFIPLLFISGFQYCSYQYSCCRQLTSNLAAVVEGGSEVRFQPCLLFFSFLFMRSVRLHLLQANLTLYIQCISFETVLIGPSRHFKEAESTVHWVPLVEQDRKCLHALSSKI